MKLLIDCCVTEVAKYALQTTLSRCGLVTFQSLALVMRWLWG